MKRLPVHPDLAHLSAEAATLAQSNGTTLDAARQSLAMEYGAPDWHRIELACQLIDAIWADDLDTVRTLVASHPWLVHEDALVRKSNWGRPMSYAANLGRDRIITFLHESGATDHHYALDRAALQGQVATARMLHEMLGRPALDSTLLGGAAYTLSVPGTRFLLDLGVPVVDATGKALAPIHVVLESDSRRSSAKHEILELYAQHGCPIPDTPIMAFHRGRLDLLQQHLARDPSLLHRTFSSREIFPPELGCGDEWLPRTTLEGVTLLHLCVEFDEMEIAEWLLDRGMDANVKAAVDLDGFGGHTALFHAVVSFPNFWLNRAGNDENPFATLLLSRGADPSVRASMREHLQVDGGWKDREFRNITASEWGEVFGDRRVVSEGARRNL